MCSQKFSVARWAALCIKNCLKPHGVIFRHSPNCTRFLSDFRAHADKTPKGNLFRFERKKKGKATTCTRRSSRRQIESKPLEMCSQKFSVARWAALCSNICLKPHGVISRHSPNCTRFLCVPLFAHPQRGYRTTASNRPFRPHAAWGGRGAKKAKKVAGIGHKQLIAQTRSTK